MVGGGGGGWVGSMWGVWVREERFEEFVHVWQDL
jgi:hypothetical protein